MKKYKFTGQTMQFEGRTLRRIRYISSGKYFNKGGLGGWIESEDNVSHEGNCAVLLNAKVFGNARIEESALVSEHAVVKDNALLRGDCYVFENATVGADTIVDDHSWISGKSKISFYSNAIHGMFANKYPQANVSGDTDICGSTCIEATGMIHDSRIINAILSGHLNIEKEIL